MIIKRQYITVLVHVLLWALLGFVLLTYTPLTWGVPLPAEFWAKQTVQYIVLVVLFYFNMHVMVPRLLMKNKMVSFVVINLAIVLGVMLITNYYDRWTHLPGLLDSVLGIRRIRHKSFDVFMLYTVLLVLGISTSIAAIQRWQKDVQLRLQLQQQQISSELSFLKAQIHPHFFFNTLNNIYALTYSDIETSRDALHKLSWMMRYLLYETQHDVTLLSNELRFLKGYIELMKLRLNKHTTVVYGKPEVVNDQSIAPMLLMSFVENAFKHGVSATREGEIWISVEQQGNKVILEVRNPVQPQTHEVIEDGGIGLTNTIRRLDLLYKDRYTLTYGLTAGDMYRVHLEIELA